MDSKKKTISDKILDGVLYDQVNMDKYSLGLTNKIARLLNAAQGEIITSIVKNDPTAPTMTEWKQKRLEKINKDITNILNDTFDNISQTTNNELNRAGIVQAAATINGVNSAVGVEILDVMITPTGIKSIVENTLIDGKIIGDWWDKQCEDTKYRLTAQMAEATQALQIGMVQGESVGELVTRIKGTKLKPGIMDVSKREAKALVRTSVMQVANAVRQETYKKNSDIINGIQWLSTLDTRTTPICRALDKKQFDMQLNPIGHSIRYPGCPAHWGCRSTCLPIIKSYSELSNEDSPLPKDKIRQLGEKVPIGERATMGDPVSGDMNYNDWLLIQSPETQQEILGKKRYQLWSNNKLDMADLIDNKGNTLTIKQLEDKYK